MRFVEQFMTGSEGEIPEGDDRIVDPNATQQTKKDIEVVDYEGWSPTTIPQYLPKAPVPYKTFSETFRYYSPMAEDLAQELEREGMMY